MLNATRQAGATLGVAAMGAVGTAGTGSGYALLLPALMCAAAGAWFATAR
jgi:DHA2 family methylenomycin A resistance protein-like MFS transporter